MRDKQLFLGSVPFMTIRWQPFIMFQCSAPQCVRCYHDAKRIQVRRGAKLDISDIFWKGTSAGSPFCHSISSRFFLNQTIIPLNEFQYHIMVCRQVELFWNTLMLWWRLARGLLGCPWMPMDAQSRHIQFSP